jgi:hypothetical protein
MMNQEQLQLQIASQACIIADLRRQLKHGSLPANKRHQLENEMLHRVHLRFVALHALQLMTTPAA